MDRALNWFVRGWVALAIAVNVISVVGIFGGAHGFWDGWHQVAEIYSPFNLRNYLMELVLISPAIGAYAWLQRRTKHEAGPPGSMSTQEALQIFDAYGDAMSTPPFVDALMGKAPRDLRTLPYPKERIKQALLTLLRLTPPGAAREPLEFGYVRLGDWQDIRVSDPTAAMLAEGKALLAELHSLGF
jgi:hypothetical protein